MHRIYAMAICNSFDGCKINRLLAIWNLRAEEKGRVGIYLVNTSILLVYIHLTRIRNLANLNTPDSIRKNTSLEKNGFLNIKARREMQR